MYCPRKNGLGQTQYTQVALIEAYTNGDAQSIFRKMYPFKHNDFSSALISSIGWMIFMFERITWESVYNLWKIGSYQFPPLLSDRMSVETVFVEYNQTDYIYGYDWLETTEAQAAQIVRI